MYDLPLFYYDEIIKTALKEDINYLDVTSDYLMPPSKISSAKLIAKDNGILCGVLPAARTFELLDSDVKINILKNDGEEIKYGDVILGVTGKTRMLLKAERTALNIIQHTSGIASYTKRCVDLISHTNAKITDTRKNLPGLRALQKYAVTVGGGKNHRFNLSDAVLIKDNHIDAVGGIIPAVEILRSKIGHTTKIEVETRNIEEVKQALSAGVDIIMLDNMSPETATETIKLIQKTTPAPIVEISGGITIENLKDYAETGVDIISLGALTHSVKAFDISMKISF